MSVQAMKWAADILCAHDLTATQRLVLVCLANHHHNTTGACFPCVETVALFAGVSSRRVQLAMRDLEAFGLVKRRKRVTSRGQSSNQYELFGRFKRGDKKSGARGDASVRATGVTLVSPDKDVSLLENQARVLRIVGGRDA